MRSELPDGAMPSLLREIGSFHFIPLVTSSYAAVVNIRLHFLRPGGLGEIVSRGGDIDNRLKTLFDALTVPQLNALPDGDVPSAGESPFYVLLEDDRLIANLQVDTASLLEPNVGESEVVLLLHVATRVTHATRANSWLS
jgi:hypothetical protein